MNLSSKAPILSDERTNAGEEVLVRSQRDHRVRCEHLHRSADNSEGIMALQAPEMRGLYDLKVFVVRRHFNIPSRLTMRIATPTSCWRGGSEGTFRNEAVMWKGSLTKWVSVDLDDWLTYSIYASSRTATTISFSLHPNLQTSLVSFASFTSGADPEDCTGIVQRACN